MVIYPSKAGFDAWESLGNDGWNWDVLAPYFRKMHTLTLPSKESQEALGLKYVVNEHNGTGEPFFMSKQTHKLRYQKMK